MHVPCTRRYEQCGGRFVQGSLMDREVQAVFDDNKEADDTSASADVLKATAHPSCSALVNTTTMQRVMAYEAPLVNKFGLESCCSD